MDEPEVSKQVRYKLDLWERVLRSKRFHELDKDFSKFAREALDVYLKHLELEGNVVSDADASIQHRKSDHSDGSSGQQRAE